MLIPEFIYQFLNDEIPLADFEKWVYQTPELEEILGSDSYFDLISFNFHGKDALYQVKQMFMERIGIGRYEAWRIRQLLLHLINDQGDPVETVADSYNFYCAGYHFFQPIGMMHVREMDDIPRLVERELWDEVAFAQKRTTLQPYVDSLKPIAQKLLEAIDNKQIQITGEHRYKIEPDLESELKQKYFMPVVQVAQG